VGDGGVGIDRNIGLNIVVNELNSWTACWIWVSKVSGS